MWFMNLNFDTGLVKKYKSISQKIRILTESWVNDQIFCPSCGGLKIDKYRDNRPVADFFCVFCGEDYELKSKKDSIGTKIVDGAYRTMIERLSSNKNPNFFWLSYDATRLKVIDFFVIPKHFFTPEIIEKRKPLSENAKRAGWVGCNILAKNIPQIGKIFFVRNQIVVSKSEVLSEWRKTFFLREEKEIVARGWLLDVISCIERLGKKDFFLDEIYAFEKELIIKYPKNKYITDKIRQQLQILRDKGYLSFVGRGQYKLN